MDLVKNNIFSITRYLLKDKNIINTSMEKNSDIISNLKFISKIKKGEKINVKFMYLQSDNVVNKLYRTFIHPDNRCNTLQFIMNTIQHSFDLIGILKASTKPHDVIFTKNIIRDLLQAKTGLNNLKLTYDTDIKFCCDMDTQIQKIDTKMVEIDDNLKDFLTEEDEE